MTIGPAMEVGGNVVEMRTDGKVQVTNPKGKVKTLTQDEFKKQTIKNADKIASGEDFEYKKDHKGLKIAGAAAGTVAVSLGIIYRKEIGKYMRNFTFKKFWNDIKDLFKSTKDKLKDNKAEKNNYTERLQKRKDAREAFSNESFNPEKGSTDVKNFLDKVKINEKQYSTILDVVTMPKDMRITEAQHELLPPKMHTKEACEKFVNHVREIYSKAAGIEKRTDVIENM